MTAENNYKDITKKKKASKRKKLNIFLICLLTLILILISSFFIMLKVGESKLRGNSKDNSAYLPTLDSEEIPEDADAYYNGEAYNYNDKLINILLIGVDRDSKNELESHQADALYLISLNTDDKKVNVLPISRNTLVDVDVHDINGKLISTQNQQICLSYSYSTDSKKSSENTVNSVSKLLYGVPISGYYTVYMNSINEIVDAVGGVPVTLTEDLTKIDWRMKAGATVTITGKNAVGFLQFRGESNAPRAQRQKLFVSSFISKAKQACSKDLSLPLKMYNKLANNTVTNVTVASATYLASRAIEAEFSFLDIEGVYGFDGKYETFTVDDSQLYKLLLDNFYKKTNK